MIHTRRPHTLLALTLAIGLCGFATGCNPPPSENEFERSHPVPTREENTKAAKDLTRDAERAEARGDYSSALDHYKQLRSFPDYAKPKDLESRIQRIEAQTRPLPWAK